MLRNRSILGLVAFAAVLAGDCGQAPVTEPDEAGPAIVEPIDGTALSRVTLTDSAAERVGIETVAVASGTGGRLMVPNATVLYDANGQAWVYTNPEGHVFVRAPITIVGTQGDDSMLSEGPAVETQVVTVGVPELYGTELGVGDPE
jgi:hypothetical protein